MKLIKIEEPAKKVSTIVATNPELIKIPGTYNQISLTAKDSVNPSPTATDKEIEKRSIQVYPLKIFKEKILHKENIWQIYKFDQADWNLLVKDPTNYQNYVCGYLEYYDTETRNGMSDHGIFFHWGKWDKHPYCCVIFIDPPPMRKLPSFKNDPRADRWGNPYFGKIEEVDPPVNRVSDPPKPPPPPPPQP